MQETLRHQLITYLSSPDYEPQDVSAISRGMGIDSQWRKTLREVIREEEEGGRLLRVGKGRLALRKPTGGNLTGRVVKRGGDKLFFVPDEAGMRALRNLCRGEDPGALPISAHVSHGAMDGDRVEVSARLQRRRDFRRRGPKRADMGPLQISLRVEEILERAHNCWVGIYKGGGRYGLVKGDGKASPEYIEITEPAPPDLLPFMSVVVEPLAHPIGNMPAKGRITKVLGWPEDAGVQITTILHKYELADAFPQQVLDESAALPECPQPQDLKGRHDWRGHCVITIDPASARDFDDAISVRRCSDGWELAVHIADVSHYVRPGSALDREAQQRGNSTYLPDRVLPMLPPRLCDGICSLREGVDRLTRLCLMRINAKGETTKARFHDAVICSRKRLTYPQALEVLEGRGSCGDAEVDAMLQEAHALAQVLRKRRFAKGALNLDMPELRVVTDDAGQPVDVEAEESDISHQLVEEFMLAANEAVAHALNAHTLPAIYRVHEAPDPAKLREFAQQVQSYGIVAGTLATREEIVRVMDSLRGHPDEPILKVALLRAMMRARYSPKPLGHFGLAKGDYCHFTSPIRRYADLVVHRAFSRLSGTPEPPHLPDAGRLESISNHISETERISAAAENEAQQQMLVLYLQQQCEAENPRVWDAVVTATYGQGLAVEVPLLRIRGFVSGADLPGGRWYHERHADRWASFDGGSLKPGDTLQVVPVRTDWQTGFVDFRPVTASEG